MVRDFSTYVIGEVHFDTRHAIWVLWHAREAALGDASWPWTTLLHFPYGMSVLVDGVGPVNAVLAWPFWPWGAAAAFNGVVLSGCTLSGWMLYLLARHVGLDRGIGFWAGAAVHGVADPSHRRLRAPREAVRRPAAADDPRRARRAGPPPPGDLGGRPGVRAARRRSCRTATSSCSPSLGLGLVSLAALYRAEAGARRRAGQAHRARRRR